jgi:hypothetical protein
MTEEEFKDLTGSLETVGHYVPTVRDMFQFLVDRKGYFRVDPENPKSWRGYAGVKLNENQLLVEGQDADYSYWDMLAPLDYFPEAGRFEVAIKELLSIKNIIFIHEKVISQYEDLAREFGLELQLTSTNWSAQFVITLPAEELIAEFEKYEALINKL